MKNILNFIHTLNFYTDEQLSGLTTFARELTYQPSEFGSMSTLAYCQSDHEKTFSSVMNTPITIHPDSGNFYRPNTGIHFNTFENFNMWKFAVAIEPTIFTMFYHSSGAKSALDGVNFNYNNMFEWEYQTQIMMEPGQGLFYRPWMFHSFASGSIIQKFDIVEQPNKVSVTILVMGKEATGKTTFAKTLSEKLDASYLNSNEISSMFNDAKVSDKFLDENNQAIRLKRLALLSEKDMTVIDFSAKRISSRDYLAPDIIIWMDTDEKASEDFEPPLNAKIIIKSLNYNIDEITKVLTGQLK